MEEQSYMNNSSLSYGSVERPSFKPNLHPITCETYTCIQYAKYAVMGSTAAPFLAHHLCEECAVALVVSAFSDPVLKEAIAKAVGVSAKADGIEPERVSEPEPEEKPKTKKGKGKKKAEPEPEVEAEAEEEEPDNG